MSDKGYGLAISVFAFVLLALFSWCAGWLLYDELGLYSLMLNVTFQYCLLILVCLEGFLVLAVEVTRARPEEFKAKTRKVANILQREVEIPKKMFDLKKIQDLEDRLDKIQDQNVLKKIVKETV